MNPTQSQQRAMEAQGNTVVVAGAGTGKTHTLVERCVRMVLAPENSVSIDQVLVVTFTEAAAAEVRRRIRARLEAELRAQPGSERIAEQIALLDGAYISTLHSFCLRLIGPHFYELGLDPRLRILAQEEATILAESTLDDVFDEHYAGRRPGSEAVRNLLLSQARGWAKPIRDLILKIHHYTQTQPNPDRWFRDEIAKYAEEQPGLWTEWLGSGLAEWPGQWKPTLQRWTEESSQARTLFAWLERLETEAGRQNFALVREIVAFTDKANWPQGSKGELWKKLQPFFSEANFFASLLPDPLKPQALSPLAEDWQWVRGEMRTLLELAEEFALEYSRAKLEEGVVDFHDLEQFALRLLWDFRADRPRHVAELWRDKLRLVFVDEYQDINAAQDKILSAISGPPPQGNRFLVGDAKQSIYRFRQAAPDLFRDYAKRWGHVPAEAAPEGNLVYLSDNFRSHECLIRFINGLFARVMREEAGGIVYDEDSKLRFGDPEGRAACAHDPESAPKAQIHLRVKTKSPEPEEEPADNSGAEPKEERAESEAEAQLVASILSSMKREGRLVWDRKEKLHRPVEWRDMVVLLRSVQSKAESYAKEFDRQGVPLQVRRKLFFDAIEILDLLNLLTILDNPAQDVPLLAVLRGPTVGLTLEELAEVRLCQRKESFWGALGVYHATRTDSAGWPKVDGFLRKFSGWRHASAHDSITHRLERILEDTDYLDWLLTQPRGGQRRANVRQLLGLARQFDQSRGQGLYHFLLHLKAHQEAAGDIEPAPTETENAVRLMTVHASKGLEFPVVVVADLGKRFNFSEGADSIILDETYGLCPQVKPPGKEQSYPSLPHQLAKARQRNEAVTEEMRILYVALTRAEDTLILVASCGEKTPESWEQASETPSLRVNNCLEWIGPYLSAERPGWTEEPEGRAAHWQWRIHTQAGEIPERQAEATAPAEAAVPDAAKLSALAERLDWTYPHKAATEQGAKTSVSKLRERLPIGEEESGESEAAQFFCAPEGEPGTSTVEPGADEIQLSLSRREIGSAHHRFLEHFALGTPPTRAAFAAQVEQLRTEGVLPQEECDSLDLDALVHFWAGDIGKTIRNHSDEAKRELPFTFRVTPAELQALNLPARPGLAPDEFLLVQGVADLLLVRREEIWVVDFKTDFFPPERLAEKTAQYAPQLHLYAFALAKIYRRPVTRRLLHFLRLRETVEVG